MNPLHAQVASRARYRCEYCHAPEAVFNFPFEVEHIAPVAAGGSDEVANLALACRACNLHKATQMTGNDPNDQVSVQLFHPREDRWDEHFEVDLESGAIIGRTATGRATVLCLDMNSAAQLTARAQWLRLGIFP